MIIAGFFIGIIVALYFAWSLGTMQSLRQTNAKQVSDFTELNTTLITKLSESALDNQKLLIINGENEKELNCVRPFIKSLSCGNIQVIISEQQVMDIATAVYSKLKQDRPSTLN